jgi:hypothetical protein
MMGCVLVLIALLAPRVAMVFIWLLTDWFSRAYDTWLLPLLGFIFLPYTTLAYMGAVLNGDGSISLPWLVFIILAAIVDIGHWGHGYRVRPRRRIA